MLPVHPHLKINDKGLLIEQTAYFTDHEVSLRTRYMRDEAGLLPEVKKFYDDRSGSSILDEHKDK